MTQALQEDDTREGRYRMAAARHGPEIARFAIGYERDPARREELVQEMHLALWQSFATYRGQCSVRTWVYRVAHNVGASHVARAVRGVHHVSLDEDEAANVPDERTSVAAADERLDLARVLALIHRMGPPDREVMLLYLEGLDAAAIGDIAGISARNVAVKIHRIKGLLAKRLGMEQRT